ncbi:conjugal transfer protein TraD [Methylovirgula sp. 4M-Z18]|nr:conjugal transfer protein TraD [Methylovirgula sp. 4M-Z18]
MWWGVPVVPLACTGMGWFAVCALSRNMLLLFLLIPVYLLMRLIVRNDDQKFRLLYLKARFRVGVRNTSFWGAHAFNPIVFKKRKTQ